MTWLLVEIISLLFISAIFSGSETGLYSLSRVKLRYKLDQGDQRARFLEKLTSPIQPTIIVILIGNNLAAQLLSQATERSFSQFGWSEAWTVLFTTVTLTPLVLICAEFVPKQVFLNKADSLMYRLVYFLYPLRILGTIPILIIQLFTKFISYLLPGSDSEIWEPHTSRPNLRTFLSSEAGRHNLAAIQQELVDRILILERIDLANTHISKPLSVLETVDGAATIAAVRNACGPKYFQRYLVTDHHDGKPVGYIRAVDLVIADGNELVSDHMQSIPHLPITMSLDLALQKMHSADADLALVEEDGKIVRVAFRSDCMRVLTKLN